MGTIIALIIAIICVGFYIYIWGVSTIGQPYLRLFIFSSIAVYFIFGYRFNVFVYEGFKAPLSDGLYYPVTYVFCGIFGGAITGIVYAFNYFRKYRPEKKQHEKEMKEHWDRMRENERIREEERKKRMKEKEEQWKRERQEELEQSQERARIKKENQIRWFDYANILEFKCLTHKRDLVTAISTIEADVTNRGKASVQIRRFDVLLGESKKDIQYVKINRLLPDENIIIEPNDTMHIKANIKKYIPNHEKYLDIVPIIETYNYSYSSGEMDKYNNFGYKIDLLRKLADYCDDKNFIQFF